MIVGKLLGGIFGALLGGPFSALLGVAVGHYFDRGYQRHMHVTSPEERQRTEQVFFGTTFSVMGRLAKADGHISASEIKQAEHLMGSLGLSEEHRQEAIRQFKLGAEPDFDMDSVLFEFEQVCAKHPNLKQMLLIYLISIALADGELHPAEEQVLHRVASALHFHTAVLDKLLSMVAAQQQFAGGGFTEKDSDVLGSAYRALGVDSSESDKNIKKAYRRLMSQHHPDKLIAEGMPDDMVKIATEKAQEIQSAYELIKKQRKQAQ